MQKIAFHGISQISHVISNSFSIYFGHFYINCVTQVCTIMYYIIYYIMYYITFPSVCDF